MIFDKDKEVISDDDLSNSEESSKNGEKLHFYYNREERLKHAPKIVRDYYDGSGGRPVKGLFRVLVANRGNRIMLISVILFAAFVWFYSSFSERKSSTFMGASVTLSAFSYEDSVYASMKFSPPKNKRNKPNNNFAAPVSFPVNVLFSAVDNNGGISAEQEVNDVYNGEDLFIRTRFNDYDIIKVKAVLSSGAEQKDFFVTVEKR